jgi:hypothetical protein
MTRRHGTVSLRRLESSRSNWCPAEPNTEFWIMSLAAAVSASHAPLRVMEYCEIEGRICVEEGIYWTELVPGIETPPMSTSTSSSSLTHRAQSPATPSNSYLLREPGNFRRAISRKSPRCTPRRTRS